MTILKYKYNPNRSIIDDLTTSLFALETLELGSCDVTDDDVSKILSQTPYLARLVLTCNPKVTETSITAILGRNPTMALVNVGGCSEISKPPDPLLKLANPEVCTLMANVVYKVVDSWEQLWEGKCISKRLPDNLVIFKSI